MKRTMAVLAVVALAAVSAPGAGATVPPKDCGMVTVKSKRYQIKADQITCRTAKTYSRRYRKLKRKRKGQQVTVSVLTRDSGKTLRTASMRVTLRAKR